MMVQIDGPGAHVPPQRARSDEGTLTPERVAREVARALSGSAVVSPEVARELSGNALHPWGAITEEDHALDRFWRDGLLTPELVEAVNGSAEGYLRRRGPRHNGEVTPQQEWDALREYVNASSFAPGTLWVAGRNQAGYQPEEEPAYFGTGGLSQRLGLADHEIVSTYLIARALEDNDAEHEAAFVAQSGECSCDADESETCWYVGNAAYLRSLAGPEDGPEAGSWDWTFRLRLAPHTHTVWVYWMDRVTHVVPVSLIRDAR
jgi:hypothetical protein